jgi:hypothetical protein
MFNTAKEKTLILKCVLNKQETVLEKEISQKQKTLIQVKKLRAELKSSK